MILDLYELAWRPAGALIGRTDAMTAHARTVDLMRTGDRSSALAALARLANRAAFPRQPLRVGSVELPHPIILAAGLVKGDGFADEGTALEAVRQQRDIVPGWSSAPALLGPVEFGSYTRHPRLGEPGRVLWRDRATRSMQNRVGLRNPGARAAAAHLARHATRLPAVWGLNLAVSPGLETDAQRGEDIAAAVRSFTEAFAGLEAGPSWLTLNLSCPNTEDDPRGTQSAELARRLAGVLVEASSTPLWLKLGPDLSDTQLEGLVAACVNTGVQAVVATNTWAQPLPHGGDSGGVSGARLRPRALDTVARLDAAIRGRSAPLDIVACGGILEGSDLLAAQAAGARAAMIYSALVFRGPLAGALILREAARGRHA